MFNRMMPNELTFLETTGKVTLPELTWVVLFKRRTFGAKSRRIMKINVLSFCVRKNTETEVKHAKPTVYRATTPT